MLVLTRKPGEVIRIGDDITITLLDIDRNKAKIGIEAPRSVPVYRQELLDHVAEEERQRRADAACPVAALYQEEALEGGGSGG